MIPPYIGNRETPVLHYFGDYFATVYIGVSIPNRFDPGVS
jgi:hypothetical protein